MTEQSATETLQEAPSRPQVLATLSPEGPETLPRATVLPTVGWPWRMITRGLGIPQIQRTISGRPAQDLPQRLRRLLTLQEEASERLIGWAQLLLVVVLSAFWWLTPRPSDVIAQTGLSPVPIALAVYGVVTMARLRHAYQARLSPPVLVGSIVLDMVLLTGLIWAFHVQYGQPAAFSLKLPTFVYFFVFIVLRALCLDWRYVVVAGLTAAASWAALTVIVLGKSADDVRTRSLVAYLTENRVLLGAEVEKIAVLLAVTAVLAIVVYRAEATLVRAISFEAKGNRLSRFVSHGLADRIAGAPDDIAPGEAVERDAAVLVLDIRGFTRYAAEHSAREVVALLTESHARLVPIVRAHGGVIDKFLGDGLMATFGAVTASTTAAADALRALDATMLAVKVWRDEVNSRSEAPTVDINGAVVSGPVLFAALGALDRLEYTVIGPAANLAAKLEKHNKRVGSRALTLSETLASAVVQGYVAKPNLRTIRDEYLADTPDLLDIVVIA